MQIINYRYSVIDDLRKLKKHKHNPFDGSTQYIHEKL